MSEHPRGPLGLIIGIVGFLLVAGMGVALYFLMIAPAMDDRKSAQNRLETKERDVVNTRQAIGAAEQRRNQIARDANELEQALAQRRIREGAQPNLSADESRLEELLGTEGGLSRLESLLEARAVASGSVLKTFEQKGEPNRQGPLLSTPFRIVVTGPYAALAKWLSQTATLPGRVLSLQDFKLSRREAIASPYQVAPSTRQRLELSGTLLAHTLANNRTGAAPRMRVETASSPAWSAVRSDFWRLADQDMSGQRDPFLPQLGGEDAPGGEDEPAPASPLTAHPTADYKVKSTDPENERAEILDPSDQFHRIQLDTQLGDKGGFVIEIRADAVVVEEPETDSQTILEVEP